MMIIDIILAIIFSLLLIFYIKNTENFKFYNWAFIFCTILLIGTFITVIYYKLGII